MFQIASVVTDRGSKYAVSGAPAHSKADALALIKELKRNKRFAKATHNTWALLCSDGRPIKNDDGESGAGVIILRMLERAKLQDHLIVVTRWYGGTLLGGDRFRRVQDCVNAYLEQAPNLPPMTLQND
ncbi:YigZ family protein [Planktotalea sp.]|uniref:YigZ family protein n=1 Tax=Planktotalea sp. TaxID=2029877 RepID=UPI0025F61226|nr:YigZ family protein [Planktotalea sp.]